METNKRIRVVGNSFIFEEGWITPEEIKTMEAFIGPFPSIMVNRNKSVGNSNNENPSGFVFPENVEWFIKAIPCLEALGFEVEVEDSSRFTHNSLVEEKK